MIEGNFPIRKLDLNFNHITDVGALAIADALMKNTALKTLNLAWNRIGKLGIARLSAFHPRKSGPYKRKVILEKQFRENGDLPAGMSPPPKDVPESELGEVWKPACDNPPCDRNKIVRAMDALESAQTELDALKPQATKEELELARANTKYSPEVDKANAKLAASLKMLEEARKATVEVISDPIQAAVKAANDALIKLDALDQQAAANAAEAMEAADEAPAVSGLAGADAGVGGDADALVQVKAGLELLESLEADLKAIVEEEKLRRQSGSFRHFDALGKSLIYTFTAGAALIMTKLIFVNEATGEVKMWPF